MTNQAQNIYVVDGVEYSDFWAALAAPLRPDQIKVHEHHNYPYIEAEDIIDRLNNLCPGDWQDDYEVMGTYGVGAVAVQCRLTIAGVTHSDVGTGEPTTKRDGNLDFDAYGGPYKKAVTDAIKRAARKFGIGLELWVDPQGSLRKARQQQQRQPAPPPPAQAAAHWIDSADMRKRFWAWVKNDCGLAPAGVYEILGVARMHDYQGSAADAANAIKQALAPNQESAGRETQADGPNAPSKKKGVLSRVAALIDRPEDEPLNTGYPDAEYEDEMFDDPPGS